MEKKTLLESLSDSFKSGFRSRIEKAETIESVIELLEKKTKKLQDKLTIETDAKKVKRLETQLVILEAQINKAKEQSKAERAGDPN